MKVQLIARHQRKTVEVSTTTPEALSERLSYLNQPTSPQQIREQLADYNKASVLRFTQEVGGKRCTMTARRES